MSPSSKKKNGCVGAQPLTASDSEVQSTKKTWSCRFIGMDPGEVAHVRSRQSPSRPSQAGSNGSCDPPSRWLSRLPPRRMLAQAQSDYPAQHLSTRWPSNFDESPQSSRSAD